VATLTNTLKVLILSAVILLALVLPNAAKGAVAITQHVVGDSLLLDPLTQGNIVVCTLASTGTAHNLIVGAQYDGPDGISVAGVSDNRGNTYSHATGSGTGRTDVWHSLNATSAVTSVTITFSVPTTNPYYRACFAYELSGSGVSFDSAAVVNDGRCAAKVCTGATITTGTSVGFVLGIITGTTITTISPDTGNEFTSGGDLDIFPPTQPTWGVSASASLISATQAAHFPAWHCGPGDTRGLTLDRFWSSTVGYKQ
jgi:hypothetical protein